MGLISESNRIETIFCSEKSHSERVYVCVVGVVLDCVRAPLGVCTLCVHGVCSVVCTYIICQAVCS